MNNENVVIAKIRTDFPEKFGIPRQSGLVSSLSGIVYFEPEYRNPDAVKGLEGFSHIWLLWKFDVEKKNGWTATVRPPRLGGNTHMGVFATRSPYRPNSIGLSCVELKKIEYSADGPLLYVQGADLRDNTEIIDIKPYLPYADAYPDAKAGWAGEQLGKSLEVLFDTEAPKEFTKDDLKTLEELLALDPRPAYQEDPDRIYGMKYRSYEIRFYVKSNQLHVVSISKE